MLSWLRIFIDSFHLFLLLVVYSTRCTAFLSHFRADARSRPSHDSIYGRRRDSLLHAYTRRHLHVITALKAAWRSLPPCFHYASCSRYARKTFIDD